MDVWTVVGILAIAAAVLAFLKARAYRETYVITCPDNLEPAAVKMTATINISTSTNTFDFMISSQCSFRCAASVAE